jgi:hypothetical protein
VIFGSSLIWTGFTGLDTRTVIFAIFAILIRVPVYLVSMIGSDVDKRGRLLIAWFGPSGLSSLLLILLAVFAGVAGSDQLFRICALVVLISVVVHGSTPMLFARLLGEPRPAAPPLPEPQKEPRPLPVLELVQPVGSQSITLEELDQLQKSGEQVILLDVRTERSRDTSDYQAEGSIRMPPENVVAEARQLGLAKEAWLIAYCA